MSKLVDLKGLQRFFDNIKKLFASKETENIVKNSVPLILDIGDISLTNEAQGTAPEIWGATAWSAIKTGKYGFIKGKDTMYPLKTDIIVAITLQGYHGDSADPEEEDTYRVEYMYEGVKYQWRGDSVLTITHYQEIEI